MPTLLILGLVIALAAAPLSLALFKWLHLELWTIIPRLAFWLAAIVVLIIAIAGVTAWRAHLGFVRPTWGGVGWAVLAVVVTFAVIGAHLYMQQKLGKHSRKQVEVYQALLGLPFSYRCFIVVTAAVTEEVLYRAYAIGVGEHLLGSLWVASVISVVAFTFAHFRWGLAHLIPVFVSGVVFTLLFVITHNLWLCIVAHAVVDGIGFLVMPVASSRRRSQLGDNAG